MTTSRQEIAEAAQLWEWEELKSPLLNELIYRRGDMHTIFCQFDVGGTLRAATRLQLDNRLRKVCGEVGWNTPRKVATVVGWFAADGARPVRRAAVSGAE